MRRRFRGQVSDPAGQVSGFRQAKTSYFLVFSQFLVRGGVARALLFTLSR
jgi:hypothetical protein